MKKFVSFLLIFAFLSPLGWAEDESIYAYPVNNGKLRSDFWRPLASIAVPGLSQWIGRQFSYAALYSGVGLAGAQLATSGLRDGGDYESFTERDDALRRALLGDALFKIGGGMSAYHSFRSAVITRRESGQYGFLPKDVETPLDLALAPFDFTYLARPTTFTPLLVLIGAELMFAQNQHWNWSRFHLGDAGFTAGVSYGAGVGEEAMFRGFLLPFATEYTGRFWLGNSTQALIFGAVHYSDRNRFPIAQALSGAYLGWLMRHRNWQMAENIFLHTWWDVIAIASEFAVEGKVDFIPLPGIEFSY